MAKSYKGGQYHRKRWTAPDGSVHDVYGKTIAERDEKLEALKASYADPQPADVHAFVYEYAAKWYALREPHWSEDMRYAHRYNINHWICPVIGQKEMAEVKASDLQEVMGQVADKSRSYNKRLLSTIKQIFGMAYEDRLIDRDPSAKLKAEGVKPIPKDALTEEEQEILLNTVRGLPIEPFVMLALYTGLRREEICGLQWRCVHLDAEAPHLDVRRAVSWPGNNKPVSEDILKSDAAWRTVPLPAALVSYLRQLKASIETTPEKLRGMYVFRGTADGPASYSAFTRRWDAITVRSTASGHELGETIRNHKIKITIDFLVSPHILRYTYCTRLILAKVPVNRVQYLMGHEDPQTTLAIYTRLLGHQPEDLIDDVEAAFRSKQPAGEDPAVT